MSRPPRGLTAHEAAIWGQVARTVTPMPGRKPVPALVQVNAAAVPAARLSATSRAAPPVAPAATGAPPTRPLDRHGLDAGWERKLAKGVVTPDFTLDLHGADLNGAHMRLDHGLMLALAQGARTVLLITGKPRQHDELTARGERRGAIRAKFLDWLAAGPHASRIAAIRPAHPRHGGAGAVYIVLKRPRG